MATVIADLIGRAELAAIGRVQAITNWELDHVRHVERLAALLFARLREYHALGPAEERLLRAAALLHDVGYPIDADKHHKVSARIIRASLSAPFAPAEVELIALLARYHRKSVPKLRHDRYAALDERRRRIVVWLGGILRIADGLDRPHRGTVRAIWCSVRDERLSIAIAEQPARATAPPPDVGDPTDDPVTAQVEECRLGGMRKRDLLELAIGKPVVIHDRARRIDARDHG